MGNISVDSELSTCNALHQPCPSTRNNEQRILVYIIIDSILLYDYLKANQLKDQYRQLFTADYLAWMLWANVIQCALPRQHQILKDSGPPAELSGMFSKAPISHGEQSRQIWHENAAQVNKSVGESLQVFSIESFQLIHYVVAIEANILHAQSELRYRIK